MKSIWIEFKVYVLLGAALALPFGSIAFMLADNQFPFTYIEDGSYIEPANAREGQQITVHWRIKVNRVCDGSVQRVIIDANTDVVEATYDAARAAATVEVNSDHLTRTFSLPAGIAPGPKKYRANLFYSCNFIQQFYPLKGTTPTLRFEVVDTKAVFRSR